MSTRTLTPPLADAANILSDQLRKHLRALGKVLLPELSRLETKYLATLQQLGFGPKHRAALAAITFGNAARLAVRGRRPHVFLEQVEYSGCRLAKLNLPPTDIVGALAEYDRLLTPALQELLHEDYPDCQWVREQLHYCVILTLNRTYYLVRETEAQAFYELFRTELEARSLDDLLKGSLRILTKFCGAREAQLYMLDEDEGRWNLRAKVGPGGRLTRLIPTTAGVSTKSIRKPQLAKPRSIHVTGRANSALLDAKWQSRFHSAWSVPLLSGDRIRGVMQFAFPKRYDWLVREQQLLEAAAERCTVAAEKAQLVENLAAREEQIRRLAEHMLHIEEVERRRISRELHDEAGQSLLCIRLQLEMLQTRLEEGSDLHCRVQAIREITEHTIVEARRLIAALSPAVLQQLGLGAALRQLVNRFRQLHDCQVTLQVPPLNHLSKQLETIVYRLAQECFNNIAKHSHAANVNISLTLADEVLRLNVEDDGVGFQVSEALTKQNSFGLAGMRERVTLLGGNFEVASVQGSGRKKRQGTRITAELPIPAQT